MKKLLYSLLLILPILSTKNANAYIPSVTDWRTKSTAVAPTLLINGAWERYDGAAWVAQAASPNSFVGVIGQVIFTVNGAVGTTTKVFASNIIITNGVIVSGGYNSTTTTLTDNAHNIEVESGGTFEISNNFAILSGGTSPNLIIRNGATLSLNTGMFPRIFDNSALWNGVELFETGSTVFINNWADNGTFCRPNSITANADGFLFGNISYEQSPATMSNAHYLIAAPTTNSTINFCKNLECQIAVSNVFLYNDVNAAGINNDYKAVIDGNFTMGGYITSAVKTGKYDLEVHGNVTTSLWYQYFSAGVGKLICNGSNNQTLQEPYGGGYATIYHLEVAKTGAGILTCGSIVKPNNMTLTSGIINANGFLIDLGVENGLAYTAGAIWGKFRKPFAGTTNTFTDSRAMFPMGKTGDANAIRQYKIAITAAPIAGSGYLQVEYITTNTSTNGLPLNVANSGGFGQIINSKNADGYWDITLFNSVGNSKTLAVQLITNETMPAGIGTTSKLTQIDRVVLADSWKANGTHNATTNVGGLLTTSRNGLDFNSGKAQYSIAGNLTPTPLQIISFSVKKENVKNIIEYELANSINVNRVEIQKSTNGVNNFEKINSHINTNGYFSFADIKINTAKLYYRIVAIDNDGSTQYSNIVLVRRDTKQNIYYSYQNNLILSSIATNLFIYNSTGQLINQIKNSTSYNCSKMPYGVYFVKTGYGATLKFCKICD